ncbi:MAG TPA: hypothetical protein VMD02_06985 [Candidatus Omnitrophota bacterium]|nr:hypothetical protein [Candidatus Omnitrophota bacterium]
MGINLGAAPVCRNLILTHLRKSERWNLEMCTRLWNLSDPVFSSGRPFSMRLSITEEGSVLPRAQVRPGDHRMFSWSGALDDETPPPGYAHQIFGHIPPVFSGIAGPGHSRIIMGGGNLDFCLLRTFESLVRQKILQNEPLEAVIPLAMTYYSQQVKSPIEYALKPNNYGRFLEQQKKSGRIGNFTIWVDDRIHSQQTGDGPAIELKWYTVFKNLLASPIFPEIGDQSTVERIFAQFKFI